MEDSPAPEAAAVGLSRFAATAPVLAAGVLIGAVCGAALVAFSAATSRQPGVEWARVIAIVGLTSGLGAVCAGLGASVFGPVRAGPLAARHGLGSHRVILTTTAFAVLVAAVAGNVLPLLVLALTGERDLKNVPGFLAAALSVSLVLLAVAYFRFIRPGVVAVRDFGFTRNTLAPAFLDQVWLAHLCTGFAGSILVVMLSAAVQQLLQAIGVQQTQLLDFTWISQAPPGQFALLVMAGSILAPLAEEIYFRGIVFRSYLLTRGAPTAYVASALVFALLHLNLPAMPPIFVLGVVLAWLYRTTGSLVPGMLAHGFNNGVAFMALYFKDSLPGGG